MSSAIIENAPDTHVSDLLGYSPSPARYDVENLDRAEAPMMLASLVPKGARVLDVGCGTGCVSTLIQRLCEAELIGVEPEPGRVKIARERGLQIVEGYLSESHLETLGKFDVVVFADVLEHCPNPGELVRLATRFLKPDGQILISVPNIAHWSVRSALLFGKFNYDQYGIMDATHLRWFTKASLEKFFGNMDLSINAMKYTAGIGLPVYRQFPLRLLPNRLQRKVVKRLARWVPRLFACQFVVRADWNAKAGAGSGSASHFDSERSPLSKKHRAA